MLAGAKLIIFVKPGLGNLACPACAGMACRRQDRPRVSPPLSQTKL